MRTMYRILAVLSAGMVIGACAPTTISPNWGTAYQNMRAKQVLNPAAGEQLDSVEGQDGKVNATAMETYRQGFEKPGVDLGRSMVSSGVKTQ